MILTGPCHAEYVIFNSAQVLPMYGFLHVRLPAPAAAAASAAAAGMGRPIMLARSSTYTR